ncbi:hypothetical protein C8N43_1853 [Litoreibacter ponti]|uniref:4Fe-4S ferredoxin-type domain-containing protein n=1 Tax=Litoreibacter ponti TaxID=1510457 RepID=A0A2T6BMH3_9RHOB|nr:ferredoxin [Litoreibacter ponti]PTX57187.1 hypothetical protein C8N43_1853 [Litoreibacter ponti]
MTLDAVRSAARAVHLDTLGAFHPDADDMAPEGTGTLVLLGPCEPGFWAQFIASPEWRDGAPDPMDRWSRRVIGALAEQLGATPLYPFGGPPYQPFFRWALRSGEAWASPVSLLVHARAGLMVSYRGALALPDRLDLPSPPATPCDTCADQPCLTACPSGALTGAGYDVPRCHAYLDTPAGAEQRAKGCTVRRACPISQSYGRVEAQSAYHMSMFHKGSSA